MCGRPVDLGGSYFGPWPPVGPGLTAHSQPVWAHPWPVLARSRPVFTVRLPSSDLVVSTRVLWPQVALLRPVRGPLSVDLPPSLRASAFYRLARFHHTFPRRREAYPRGRSPWSRVPAVAELMCSPKSRLWEASLSDLADFVVALPCPSDERRAVFRWSANVTWSASQTQGHQPISADRLRAGGRPAEPLFLHRNARANCCFRPAPPRLPWSRPDIADRLRAWRTPCRTAVFGQNARAEPLLLAKTRARTAVFAQPPPRLPWSRHEIRRPTPRVADALPRANPCFLARTPRRTHVFALETTP